MADDRTAAAAIEARVDALREAWNRQSAKDFAACFTEDAEHINVFGMLRRGRAEILSSHDTQAFRTMFKDMIMRETERRLRFIRSDVAMVDLRWEMTGSRDPQGKPVGSRYGLLSLVLTEDAGNWLVKFFHNQDLPAPERVAAVAAALRA
jgi:uncharacterized protein (TIGR02246 family)